MAIDAPLSIEQQEGKASGTVVLRLSGPLTLMNLFVFQTSLRRDPPPRVVILDLSQVPYMDSAGMGAVINYHVHCERHGGRLIAAGVSSRVLELFKMTKVDGVIHLAGTVEEAEA
jgi:anti-sigma B factor antagonist